MRAFACAAAGVLACSSAATPPVEHRASSSDPEPPSPALMARLESGAVELESLIEPDAGLLYAAYYTDPSEQDPRADETGLVKIAERVCGDALEPLLASLEKQLAPAIDGEPWRCERWVCRRDAAAEYALDQRYRFRPASGTLRLVEVVQIEGGPVTEAFSREAERWTAAALEALAGGRCR